MPAITRRSFRRPSLDPNQYHSPYHVQPQFQPQTQLHITNCNHNDRDSIGLDSLSSSVPPPRYTSLREVASSIATSDGEGEDVGEDDVFGGDEGGWEGDRARSINISAEGDQGFEEEAQSEQEESVSMHSCREVLPSPYSTEDLFAGMHPHQYRGHYHHDVEEDEDAPSEPPSASTLAPANSCVHGYTHTHSQCSVDSPTPLTPGSGSATYDSYIHALSVALPPPPPGKTTHTHSRSQSQSATYTPHQIITTSSNANANGTRRTTRHLSNPSTSARYPSHTPSHSQSLHGHGHSQSHRHDHLPSPPPLTPTPPPPPISPSEEVTSSYPRSILTQPTGSVSGHLSYTYRPLKSSYELRLDPGPDAYTESGDHTTTTAPIAMGDGIGNGSSITFLPEASGGYSASGSSHHLSGNGNSIGRTTTINTAPPFRRGRSSLSTSHVPISRGSSVAHSRLNYASSNAHPSLSPPPSKKSRATNYVSLSRKSTVRKPSLFRSQSTPSSITGEFTIDPSLYIPSALLKAVTAESSLALNTLSKSTARLPGSGTAHQSHHLSGIKNETAVSIEPSPSQNFKKPLNPKSSRRQPGPKIRRKNLFLEVENGGIDVDVHLVPSSLSASSARYSTSNVNISRAASRASFSRRPSSRRSRSEVHGFESVDTLAGFGPLGSRRQKVEPTLIDLRLKQGKLQKGGREFHLIARIHAPGPRSPFHLLASTIDMHPSPATTTDENKALPPLPTTNASPPSLAPGVAIQKEKDHQLLTRPTRGFLSAFSSLTHLSKSHLTLHIPRNFRGPLTVHVAAGNLDEHVRLSREVASAVVVLSESAFMRGYYVGGLAGEDDEEGDEGEGDDGDAEHEEEAGGEVDARMGMSEGGHRSQSRVHAHGGRQAAAAEEEEQEEEIYKMDRAKQLSLRTPTLNHMVGLTVSGDSDTAKDIGDDDNPHSSQEEGESEEDGEWNGDKVDVIVGQGKFYLQFVDEYDPFGKQKFGFWKNLISGYYNR